MPDMLERLFQNPPNGSLEMVQFQPIWTVARKGIESNKRQFVGFLQRLFGLSTSQQDEHLIGQGKHNVATF